jgi:glucose-1-phosphate cytidylyltransferase
VRAILLAGGYGTRISEETSDKPKPMVEVNGKPLLEHVIDIFILQGFNDFVVASGYKAEVIQDWATRAKARGINVVALDTGLDTQTGGRIQQALDFVGNERVFVTYGDGVGNVNLKQLLSFHLAHGKLATVTAVRPPARFGVLESVNGAVTHFGEKNQTDAGWINGGFFILEHKVKNFIENNLEPFEKFALPRLVETEQLMAFNHYDFWQPMDTLREKNDLESLAKADPVPWLRFES